MRLAAFATTLVVGVWLMLMWWSHWIIGRIEQHVDRITGVVRRDGHPAAARKVESTSLVADTRKRIPID